MLAISDINKACNTKLSAFNDFFFFLLMLMTYSDVIVLHFIEYFIHELNSAILKSVEYIFKLSINQFFIFHK